jgi:ribosomal protein S18 acetylase RimI-like enzyme
VSVSVRPYVAGDWSAVYDVCVRTGNDGEDATGKLEDVQLLPDIWAGPYMYLEPDLAFVLDDGKRAVGYVLGTADTAGFVRKYREQWIPRLVDAHPAPPVTPVTPDEQLLALLHQPERMLAPELGDYPAHLHIDVLPPHQGSGHGRRLVETFVEAVTRAGTGGVHLAVSPTNVRAHGFYQRLGFARLAVAGSGGAIYYGLKTNPTIRGGTT